MTPASDEEKLQRACGAACLSAVYKSLGKEIPASAIWPLIAKPNRFRILSSTTYLMTRHALSQGFRAIAVQARHPLHLLTICRDRGIAAILNHRLRDDSPTGHYSILADIDDACVVLRDAASGATRRVAHAEMLRLWQPLSQPSEILGSVLIGISANAEEAPPCEFCHTQIPVSVDCPKCKQPVPLRPAPLLGCIRDGCIARMWNYLCCPACDYVWTFSEAQASSSTASSPASGTGPAAPAPESIPTGADLAAVFAALDRFCELVRGVPGAAEHPDLKAQLGLIESSKPKLQQAQMEQFSSYRARGEQINLLKAESVQRLEALRQKMEDRNAPPRRLDGEALGQALLKNLGLK